MTEDTTETLPPRAGASLGRHIRRWLMLKRYGVRKAHTVIREARRADLALADALAMLELETGIPQQNIFGCDLGEGRAFCGEKVTRRRVRELLDGPYSNGIGWTQITFKPLIPTELQGRLHRPKYQMRIGFGFLAGLIREHGRHGGHAHYNGSSAAAQDYGARAVALARAWADKGAPGPAEIRRPSRRAPGGPRRRESWARPWGRPSRSFPPGR